MHSEEDVLASLRTVPVLLIDDLGTDTVTDWSTSLLFAVLDHRHDAARKTIITTNLDVPQLGAHLGERTMRRFEEGALIVTVNGPNLRRQHAESAA